MMKSSFVRYIFLSYYFSSSALVSPLCGHHFLAWCGGFGAVINTFGEF